MNVRDFFKRLLPSQLRKVIAARYGDLPRGLRDTIDNVGNELLAAWATWTSRREFQALRERRHMRVHLGCGPYIKPGWVNVDLTCKPPRPEDVPPETSFINHDLRRGLPLADGSCEMIYSAHFLEHLKYVDAMRLLRDCHRVLKPGGLFRACLPNFKRMFDAYLREDWDYLSLISIRDVLPEIEPGTETLVDVVNYGVYQHGEHKWIMDMEKIGLLLRHIGFGAVAESSFREDVDPVIELRQRYSFYVEAIK
jgi:predicted SAM-dependent methyltransferase